MLNCQRCLRWQSKSQSWSLQFLSAGINRLVSAFCRAPWCPAAGLGKAFLGDCPGRQICFLQTKAAQQIPGWSFTQSGQRSLKISRDRDVAKETQIWDVWPLSLLVIDLSRSAGFRGTTDAHTMGRGANIGRRGSEPAELLRLEKNKPMEHYLLTFGLITLKQSSDDWGE